MKFSESSPLP